MKVSVINRSNIPTISNINVNGEEHRFGEMQPFSSNDTLSAFMKKSGSTGISFVRLKPGEELEGILIRFNNKALFENTPDSEFSAQSKTTADRLIDFNEDKCLKIQSSPIFELFRSGAMEDEDNIIVFKKRFRQWSSLFQHIMYSRQFSTVDKAFSGIFLEHLKEEFGHDEMLPENHLATKKSLR